MGRSSLAVAAALVVAGCSVYSDVRDVVEAATPEGAQRVGKCFESGLWGVLDATGYSCAYFVPGPRDVVAREIAERLAAEGFTTRCAAHEPDDLLELTGERGEIRVSAEVSPPGHVIDVDREGHPLNVSRDDDAPGLDYRYPPPGHVIVELGAHELRGGLYAEWPDCLELLR